MWDVEDKAVDMVQHLLKKVNGKGYCLYYSLYSLNNKKEVERKNSEGIITKKGYKTVGLDNAEFTQVLMADLDKISKEEYIQSVELLKSVGLYTTDISSGFGYQLLIRLNHKCYDKNILKRFTETLIRKGFKADPAITDAARVARLPNTFNTKATSFRFTNMGIIPLAKTLKISYDKYSVEEVFSRLEQLEDKVILETPKVPKAIVKQIKIEDIDTSKVEVPNREPKTKTLKEEVKSKAKGKKVKEKDAEISVVDLSADYPNIRWNKVIEAVKLILAGTPGGYRNKALFFMLPYLKNELSLNREQMIEVLTVWGNKCTPIYTEAEYDVDRYLDNYTKRMTSKYGLYGDLEEIYGPLKKDVYKLDNAVNIPNMALKKLGDIKDGAFRMYLMMKREQHLTGKSSFSLEDVNQFCEIDRATFFRHIKDLTKHSLIRKQKSCKKAGEEYRYEFNIYFENASKKYGYTSFDALYIWALDKQLTDGELKLYVYLNYRIRSAEGEFKIAQENLARDIKKTQQGISLITGELDKKHFIKKHTWKDEYGVPHSDYVIIQ